MTNHNGCTGLNCPFQYNKIVQCDLTDCPYRDRPSCFTPANRQGADEGTIENAFQIGFQLGLMKACDYVDFVQVVRCKDCVYARELDAAHPGNLLVCSYTETSRQVGLMEYCSHGMRRDTNDRQKK